MTKERLQEYTLRISQASDCEMVIIMYDVILDDVACAKKAFESGDMKEYHTELRHASKFINELMKSLDFSVKMSHNFMSLYIYSLRQITRADVAEKPSALEGVTDVFEKLKGGFVGIRGTVDRAPVMKNVQQVYAGLTYGKGCLNESYVSVSDYNRGFKA